MKKIIFVFVFMIPFFVFSQTDTIPQSEMITRVFKVRKASDWLKIKLFYDSVQITSSDPISIRKLKRITFSDNTFLTTAFDGSHWNLVGNVLSPKITTNKVTADSGYYVGINRLLFGSLKNIYLGHNCGGQNSGDYFTGLGAHCGMLNTANNFTSAGAYSGKSNTGTNFSGFGYNSGYENTGFNFSGFGSYSGYRNTGNNVLALGATSGYSNNLDSAIYIGFGTVGFDTSNILLFGRQTLKNPHLNINGNLRIKEIVYVENGIFNIGNLTSTNGNINITNGTGSVIIDSNWFGAINGGHFGVFKGSLVTGTSISNGLTFIEDGNKESYMGYHRQVGGSSKNQKAIEYDTTRISMISGLNHRETSISIRDTGYHIKVPSKTIMSADSGGNHFKIYVPLIANGTIINGGLINKDTVLILADDATFNFPTSVGWADIQCDSVLIEKTWGIVSWNGDGSTSLRSNGAKFVNTDTDGNYACFYDGGVYAILKNTSGYTQTYSIKYHYHN